MRTLLVSVVTSLLLAGCYHEGSGAGSGLVDPFSGECDFPQIPAAELGDNAAFVGGVADFDDVPIQGVEVIATPQDPELAQIVDTTNDGGCYFLSFDVDVVYDITWGHDEYLVQQMDAVKVGPGEKRIQHVYLRDR